MCFQEEQERREQKAKELEEKRLQVLQRLAASVPYAEACANAEAKLDHITGDQRLVAGGIDDDKSVGTDGSGRLDRIAQTNHVGGQCASARKTLSPRGP